MTGCIEIDRPSSAQNSAISNSILLLEPFDFAHVVVKPRFAGPEAAESKAVRRFLCLRVQGVLGATDRLPSKPLEEEWLADLEADL